MLKFQPHKDYDLSDLLKKSCQKILKILTMVACLSSCNPLWVLWNFRGQADLGRFGQFWAEIAALAESLPKVWLKSLKPHNS
jgi:hypothetical protein